MERKPTCAREFKPKGSEPRGGNRPLHSVYINLAFLDSRVERARQTLKEMEGFWGLERILKYFDDEFDHIGYCIKDLSGKVMRYIQEEDK